MTPVTLLAFAAVAFIGIATPGPTMLLALTNGSRYGIRRTMPGMIMVFFALSPKRFCSDVTTAT